MTRYVSAVLALAVLSVCAVPSRARAQTTAVPTSSTDPLIGLWGGGEMSVGPQARGDIVVERTAVGWTVRVAGFEAAGAILGDSVVISLPGGQGTLRAWLRGAMLEGYWIQPGDFDGPSYVTPVSFHSARAGAWIGTIAPADSRFSLYLNVARNDDGALLGVFRNPGANWPGGTG
ncbi:MAG: hypothetical protein ABI120_19820, partial [Gemmatimonadaceae bacterium]